MLEFNYICIEFKSILKKVLSNIRTHQCKTFTIMILIYSITILSSFLVGKGYNFSNNGNEINSSIDNIKFSSELYDLIESVKSEEESENKEYSNGYFGVLNNHNRLHFVLNSCQFDIYKQSHLVCLNKTPKYLLYHQLKIYS